MSERVVPASLEIPMSALCSLAVEWWRLSSGPSLPGAGRHALRRMEDFLRLCELEVQSMDGRVYDPGLAARVVDRVEDPGLPADQSVIEQTLSPLLLWRGQVVRAADIVVRSGGGRSQ